MQPGCVPGRLADRGGACQPDRRAEGGDRISMSDVGKPRRASKADRDEPIRYSRKRSVCQAHTRGGIAAVVGGRHVRGALEPGSLLDESRSRAGSTYRARPRRERCVSWLQWPCQRPCASERRGGRPTIVQLNSMFEAMAELEALCAGLAAERMPVVQRRELEGLHERLRVLSYDGNPQLFHEVNEAFHNAIYAGSQNGYVAEMALATRVRVQPFRRAQFRNLGRLAKSYVEHDRVVVAIMRGDRTGATRNARSYRDG